MSRGQRDSLVVLSKKLSYALRHGAVKMGLSIGTDGYVSIEELLRHRDFRGFTRADVQVAVDDNNKKRFEVSIVDGCEVIRAAQGHTISTVVDEELLTEITDPSLVPVCIHGTYRRAVDSILSTGLKKMRRNHMHFAPGWSPINAPPNNYFITDSISFPFPYSH